MLLKFANLIIFLFFGNVIFCQKINTIAFDELIGGVIMVKATLNNLPDSLNLIIDTGNSHISLDSTTAANLNLKVNSSDNIINGIGGQKRTKQTSNIALHLGKNMVDSFSFFVNDYTTLTESYGERIDGIIGYAFLSKYILNVNFDSSFIHFYKNGEYPYPKKGFVWKLNLNFLPTVNLTFTDLKKNKNTEPFYLDCGAGLSLLISEDFLADKNFIANKKKPILTQVDGVGGKINTRLTVIKELKFANFKFKNVPTFLYTDNYQLLNYPYSIGLIGNDILRRFNWILNYSKKEICLTPNKNYTENFDYSYTGFALYQINGFVTITDVLENSPAQQAGIQKDDILISIDRTLITSLKQAKEILQNTRRFVKINVFRNEKLVSCKMYIKSIL